MKEFIRKFIPAFLISWYHFFLAFLGALIYIFPSKKLNIIGVTGTSGKSTVAHLITKILEEAGLRTASISSIKFKIGEKEWQNNLKMTMPGRFKIQRFLKQAVKVGCQYVVLEVTSEGIKQYRHKFINFDVAVFTNLTAEHIEAHGSFEKYKKAKSQLFEKTKRIHIVNLDDKNAEYFLQIPAEEKWGYKVNSKLKTQNSNLQSKTQKLIKAQNCQTTVQGIKFSVNNAEFNLNLLGEFNIYNALAAICVGLSQGVDLETCQKALEKVAGIPGRMEIVIKGPFEVIVDYAHTPESLEKVYETLAGKPLICVLGACGGGRDKWKRPVLGKLAFKYCKEVIITNEDPYDEDPTEIINQVAEGTGNRAKKILDRREAIGEALKIAKPGDTVIITGKGSEPWMCVAGGRKIPWDDREVVKQELNKINL